MVIEQFSARTVCFCAGSFAIGSLSGLSIQFACPAKFIISTFTIIHQVEEPTHRNVLTTVTFVHLHAMFQHTKRGTYCCLFDQVQCEIMLFHHKRSGIFNCSLEQIKPETPLLMFAKLFTKMCKAHQMLCKVYFGDSLQIYCNKQCVNFGAIFCSFCGISNFITEQKTKIMKREIIIPATGSV